jgi:ribosomal-protein-alanine N-acetyltransferase
VRTAAPALRLRPLVPSDLPAVLAIEAASFPAPWSRQQFEEEQATEWSTTLVAEAPGGQVAGFVVFWLVADELHILDVATDPSLRRSGVARALLAEAERRAAAREVALITLEVRRSNAAAQALYAGLGYARAGVRPRYYENDGEDAIVMHKALRDRGF